MLKINEFKSAVHKLDLERPNLFAVELSLPPILRDNELGKSLFEKLDNGRTITLFCKAVNLPGVNISTADNLRYGIGPVFKMPVRGNLNDISLTFLNDSGGKVHSFFLYWINEITPMFGGNGRLIPGDDRMSQLSFKKEYQTDMRIITYRGETGKFGGGGLLQSIVSVASAAAGVPFLGSLLGSRALPEFELQRAREYTVYNSYPLNVSDISFSSEASNAVTEFTVAFTYQTFSVDLLNF
jgi:hypothetical protein